MPTSLPTKMSQFENVTSLSTASYIIGLDMYAGQLANIKISGSAAGYELARKRWILNPPVTASDDPRGHDGAESYSPGQYWVKSGSVWLELVITGSTGGTISSSYQLSDGGGDAFSAGNNVTFGRANIGAITGSKIVISSQAVIGNNSSTAQYINGGIVLTGSLNVSGSAFNISSPDYIYRVGEYTLNWIQYVSGSTNTSLLTKLFQKYTSALGTGKRFIQTFGDDVRSVIWQTPGQSYAMGLNNSGSLMVNTSITVGKSVTSDGVANATLDVSGSAVITGSLVVTKGLSVPSGLTGSLLGTASYANKLVQTDVFNVKDYGATGDGSTNDTTPIQNAINAVQAKGYGTVYFPDGVYRITGSLTLPTYPQCDIALIGAGSNVSVIKQVSYDNAIYFDMNDGGNYSNEYQVAIKNLAFLPENQANTAIYVTYGGTQNSQHQNISVDINDVHVHSSGSGYWEKGIVLESAWNFRISNSMIVGKQTGTYPYVGTGLEVRRMCINGSINQSQFNFWKTGIFVNTVDYSSAGMNTEGLFADQVYMVPVHYGVYIKGNKSFFTAPFNSYDWANRPIAGRMVLFTLNDSHIDSRDSGSAIILENAGGHAITNNFLISDGTGSVVRTSNAYEGLFSGNTLLNAGTATSLYIGGYSGSANIVTANVFRGGYPHVTLESSSIYNKVYGNVSYDQLAISTINLGTSNLVGSTGA